MLRIQSGQVLDSAGKPLAPDAPTPAAQWIWYYRTLFNEHPIPFTETVLFQDDWLVVADKPHFLPVSPTGQYARETLLARLQRRLHLPHLAPLHRLDRETAGLVVFTVQPHTRDTYARLFRERSVHKEYEAIASHNPALDEHMPLLHSSHLAPHAQDFFRTAEYSDRPPNSSTLIELLETLPSTACGFACNRAPACGTNCVYICTHWACPSWATVFIHMCCTAPGTLKTTRTPCNCWPNA